MKRSHRLNFKSVLFGEARLLETELANNDADFIKCVCSRGSNPFSLAVAQQAREGETCPQDVPRFLRVATRWDKNSEGPKRIIDVQHPRAQKNNKQTIAQMRLLSDSPCCSPLVWFLPLCRNIWNLLCTSEAPASCWMPQSASRMSQDGHHGKLSQDAFNEHICYYDSNQVGENTQTKLRRFWRQLGHPEPLKNIWRNNVFQCLFVFRKIPFKPTWASTWNQ